MAIEALEKDIIMSSLHLGESVSCWSDTVQLPRYPRLTRNLNSSVVVVGGGIAGLTTAYMLMKEGKTVCVVEAFEVGSGQTAKTSAHLSSVLDESFVELERLHGLEGSRLAAESHNYAQNMIERIVHDEHIACDLQRVYGYLFSGSRDEESLKKELAAAHRAGMLDARLIDRVPLEDFHTGPAIQYPRQLEFHPMKFLKGILGALEMGRVKIFARSPVVHVHGGERPYIETKAGHRIYCQSIVVATNSPVNNLFALHTKQAAYRSYVIGLKIPRGSVPHALFWDDLDPYHYIRVEAPRNGHDYEILVVGGEDHKTGQEERPESRYNSLEKWARDRFPQADEVLYRWSGQVMEPVDGLAFLGRNPMNRDIYVITGDSGHGLTHGVIGAKIITDHIMARTNPWTEIYDPSRITLRSTMEFVKENANTAAQYADWLKTPSAKDPTDLRPGEGGIFQQGLRKVAAYKDETGHLHFMSATCTHLAGVVHWNSAEKSWDCPCHGSRFDCQGRVIEGPAVTSLKRIDGVELPPPPPLPAFVPVIGPTPGDLHP